MKLARALALSATALLAVPTGAASATAPPPEPATPTTVAGAAPASVRASWVEFAAAYRSAGDAASEPVAGEGFVFEGVDYTVTLPAEPQSTTQEAPTATPGELIDVLIHSVLDDQVRYAVSEIDVPDGVPYSLEGGEQGAVQTIGGTLVDSREIDLDGVPGREFIASFTSNGVEGTYLSRVYSDQERVWQLAVAAPGPLEPTDPAVATFFESFEFTERD